MASPSASGARVRRITRSVDAWERTHPVGGIPVAVLKKFSDDSGSSLAALVAFYAFFSLFPLLLALLSILGFVLEGNPSLRDDVLDTALARIPVIGASYGTRWSRFRAAPSRSRLDSPERSGQGWE